MIILLLKSWMRLENCLVEFIVSGMLDYCIRIISINPIIVSKPNLFKCFNYCAELVVFKQAVWSLCVYDVRGISCLRF